LLVVIIRTNRREDILILIMLLIFIVEPFGGCENQLVEHLLFTGLRD